MPAVPGRRIGKESGNVDRMNEKKVQFEKNMWFRKRIASFLI
ncbi:hypothetical protein TALC_00088 [Thermoplasmatales archaeon BRNA1]|nr:hypothetical protein TALC_00088 [Thermoplasmatales archaeon BRNA1]